MLLGELPLKEGTMDLGGASLAYSSQEPWLFVATVKQNILFGQSFDKERYWKVSKFYHVILKLYFLLFKIQSF